MLKDRKLLIETELKKLHDKAAHMYLDIVTKNGDVHSAEYIALREKIGDLQHDYKMINLLIKDGHE